MPAAGEASRFLVPRLRLFPAFRLHTAVRWQNWQHLSPVMRRRVTCRLLDPLSLVTKMRVVPLWRNW